MVFKFLQNFPLGIKSFFFQAFYALFLFGFIRFFNWNQMAFFAGFLFSQIYMLFFFFSSFLLLDKKRQKLGGFLMLVKWLVLFFVLLAVSWFLEAKAFLVGLSGLFSFLFCYVFEMKKER